jgi:hypothetical protein
MKNIIIIAVNLFVLTASAESCVLKYTQNINFPDVFELAEIKKIDDITNRKNTFNYYGITHNGAVVQSFHFTTLNNGQFQIGFATPGEANYGPINKIVPLHLISSIEAVLNGASIDFGNERMQIICIL